ncbi:exported hypothetical protein [Candidatus Zixiibacteriota bacterium]|nr:exported hypothetical protein [candidate division Zixibacteria bacterium]
MKQPSGQFIFKILLIAFLVVTGSISGRAADDASSLENAKKVDSLFIIASSAEITFKDQVQPAIDSIAAMGEKAVPRLVEKYDTQDARERLTIHNILVKIGRPAVPYLIKSLSLENPEQVSRICYTLGDIKDSAAVPGLMKVYKHKDWRIRSETAGALGRIDDQRGDKAVLLLLQDSVEIVRKSSAVAAGQMLIQKSLPLLVHMLGDSFYGARMCASEALVKFGPEAIPEIADSLASANELVGNLGCTTLGQIGGDSAASVLALQLKSPSALRRALAVEAIAACNDPAACAYVEHLKPSETDSTVLYFINKTLEKYAPR